MEVWTEKARSESVRCELVVDQGDGLQARTVVWRSKSNPEKDFRVDEGKWELTISTAEGVAKMGSIPPPKFSLSERLQLAKVIMGPFGVVHQFSGAL